MAKYSRSAFDKKFLCASHFFKFIWCHPSNILKEECWSIGKLKMIELFCYLVHVGITFSHFLFVLVTRSRLFAPNRRGDIQ